jgi:MbtH protein
VFGDESGEFRVVRNERHQFSIWPAGRPIPAGWLDAGFHGSKSECLEHIEQVWHDLRPSDVAARGTAGMTA